MLEKDEFKEENKKEVEKMTGARSILEALKEMGVDTIFGYPGGAVIPIYDAMYDFTGIDHILVRHEQSAAHAADGYARVSGKPGVCLATSGPGATNLVTGIMTAYMDSVPLVAITGQVGTSAIGKMSFQETDIVKICKSITKARYQVRDIRELPHIIKEAYITANTARKGPVLVDVPKDVVMGMLTYREYEYSFNRPVNVNVSLDDNQNDYQKVCREIAKAQKPLIIAGGGVTSSRTWKELKEFAEKIDTPVANTLMGLGTIDVKTDLGLGLIGMHGHYVANYAGHEADLVIALGTRFSDRVTGNVEKFLPKAKVVHVEIDPKEFNKMRKTDMFLQGDLKKILKRLTDLVDKKENPSWKEKIKRWKNDYPTQVTVSDDGLTATQIISHVNEITKGEALVVTDVGQHQMWTAQHYKFKYPNSFCSSGGAGTMGYGVPAAIGAGLAHIKESNRPLVAFVGDGSMQMTSQDLITVSEYKVPVKIVLINNRYLGMVRQWQQLFNGKRYSFVNLENNPEFDMLAKAYRIEYVKIEKEEELGKLKDAFEKDGPVLIDCRVVREDNVFPMIPAGESCDKLIYSKDDVVNF